MCGIIAYVGNKQAGPILVNGLKRLEYRGYDSAGIAVLDSGRIKRVRSVGKIENLSQKLENEILPGCVGIAHTRWATHGGVSQNNAHPHSGCTDELMIVHNGIIENYRELRAEYLSDHTFLSETDTEVLAHLIEKFYQGDLRDAVVRALALVRGTYGLVVMHAGTAGALVAARMGSPLVIGVGEGEYFVASDASPILPHTRNVIFLSDGEVAEMTGDSLNIFDLKSQIVNKTTEKIEWDEAGAQKQGFPHFMLKEIFDQPNVIMDAIRGRYDLADGSAHLGGLNMSLSDMHSIERVIILACGTSYYAGLVGKFAFERLAGIPTEVEIASEFRYRDPIVNKNTLVFGISQSGETADTLGALREAKNRGAYVRGIVNVVGSTIARETDGGTFIHAGPELSVASTKAFTNTAAVLILYAIQFGRLSRITSATGQRILSALLEIPEKMKNVLGQNEKVASIVDKYKKYKNFLFLGRGINFPVALEGSLKLKEITYIHSEALPAGEMKHGPIALLSEEFPVLAVMTKNQLYEKMRSNVEELRARHAPLILIATDGDIDAEQLSSDVIYVPPTMEILEPLVNTLVMQLFAYHMAVALGRDVDRPRNLAKSVTVE